MEDSDAFQLQFDRLARHLALNSMEELTDLTTLCGTICKNAVTPSSSSAKYRVLKLSNESIKRRLVGRQGGVEFLLAGGWVRRQQAGADLLELPAPAGSEDDAKEAPSGPQDLAQAQACENAQAATLLQALAWLESTTVALQAYHEQAGRRPSDSIAEVTLSLRLPTSKVVAGFMRRDPLSAVRSYAASYFVPSRRGDVSLRLPDCSAVALGGTTAAAAAVPDATTTAAPAPAPVGVDHPEATLEATLEALGLAPRAALTVTVADDVQRADLFSHTHKRAAEQTRVEKVVSSGQGQAEFRRKVQEKQGRVKQRAQALAAFEEDRAGRLELRPTPSV